MEKLLQSRLKWRGLVAKMTPEGLVQGCADYSLKSSLKGIHLYVWQPLLGMVGSKAEHRVFKLELAVHLFLVWLLDWVECDEDIWSSLRQALQPISPVADTNRCVFAGTGFA